MEGICDEGVDEGVESVGSPLLGGDGGESGEEMIGECGVCLGGKKLGQLRHGSMEGVERGEACEGDEVEEEGEEGRFSAVHGEEGGEGGGEGVGDIVI